MKATELRLNNYIIINRISEYNLCKASNKKGGFFTELFCKSS